MMKLTKLKSINTNISITFFGVFILMLSFGALFFFYVNKIQSYKEVSEQLSSLRTNTSEMNNYEYALMLKEQSNEYFINTGKSNYIEKYKLKYNENQQLIDNLTEVGLLKQLNLQEALFTIKNNIDINNATFSKLVSNTREIGYYNIGLIGELRSFIHEQENSISKLPDSTVLFSKILQIRRYEKDFLAWKSIKFKDKLIQQIEEYKKILINNPRISQEIQRKLIENIEVYQSTFIKITDKAKIVGLSSSEGLYRDQEKLNETILEDVRKLNDFFEKKFDSETINTNRLIYSYFAFACILLFILSRIHSRKLTKPLLYIKEFSKQLGKGFFPVKASINASLEVQEIIDGLHRFAVELEKKAKFAEKIGHGNIDEEYFEINENDKLAVALSEMASKLKADKANEQARKQSEENETWSSKGMALFNDILRNSHGNIDKIAYQIISKLIDYLNVTQGGIFVVQENDSEPTLELVASYAFNKEKMMKKTVHFKEGLIGTCAVEKSTLYLDQVPPRYMKLTSGLGDAEPESLLLVPILNAGNLLGIIELASFTPIPEHQIKFIEKLSENIAITFLTVQITEHTKSLLSRTLEQAEELKKRDEETRANLSRLQASQEESARREAEMTGLLTGLNASTFIVEYDIEANIVNINDKYLRILNLHRNKVLGQNHRKFTNLDSFEEYPNGYAWFWDQLRNGEIITKTTKIPTYIQKEDIWLSEVYAPVIDKNGVTKKILCIGIDISSNKKHEHILALQSQELANKEQELKENFSMIQETAKALETESLILELLVQNSKDSIFIKDAQGKYLNANHKFLKSIGLKKIEDVIGKTVYDVLDPKYATLHAENDKMIIESGRAIFNVIQHDKSERGNEYWLQVSKIPIINKNKETVGLIGITQNVTKERKGEMQVREAIENLTSLQKKYKVLNEVQMDMSNELSSIQADWDGMMLCFENSFSFCIIQLDGTIVQANELYAKQFNSKIEDLIGNNILQNLKGEAAKRFLPIWQRVTKGEPYNVLIKETNREGNETKMMVHYQPVRDKNYSFSKIFYIGIDLNFHKPIGNAHSSDVSA